MITDGNSQLGTANLGRTAKVSGVILCQELVQLLKLDRLSLTALVQLLARFDFDRVGVTRPEQADIAEAKNIGYVAKHGWHAVTDCRQETQLLVFEACFARNEPRILLWKHRIGVEENMLDVEAADIGIGEAVTYALPNEDLLEIASDARVCFFDFLAKIVRVARCLRIWASSRRISFKSARLSFLTSARSSRFSSIRRSKPHSLIKADVRRAIMLFPRHRLTHADWRGIDWLGASNP
ncbi:hypothetical protein [Ensifer sp. ENS11]|uniref:hypothetical protein n=1 Tax=Ensifer sp. ENS11 TaxID=2769291 RepID=UPI00177EA31F|nr:hypothetical protein [Ensifer sp. ENS11]MBD9490489.1 hypothetical protein [Ensifer sp. ENS11]MDP9633023.1 hypothetical protein [Ensifer adhaerens]